MKETGIIMSGDHLKLVLDGIKTHNELMAKGEEVLKEGRGAIARLDKIIIGRGENERVSGNIQY